MKDYFLTPINIPEPPKHTQIKPKCLFCKKFPVCNLREHYLKTAYLIEQILGNPNDDREILPEGCNCGFHGYDFENAEELFPATLEVEPPTGIEETTANFQGGKYFDKNTIQTLYKVGQYLVIFKINWSEEFSRYEISDGKEIYYGIDFKLTSTEFDDTNLQIWRIEKEEEEREKEDADIINTTYFSAVLNCQFYDYDKNLTEKEAYARLYSEGHNLDQNCCCGPYHLLTYHIEPKEVPYLKSNFSPNPVLYPVFIPRPAHKHHCKPPVRRDDIND